MQTEPYFSAMSLPVMPSGNQVNGRYVVTGARHTGDPLVLSLHCDTLDQAKVEVWRHLDDGWESILIIQSPGNQVIYDHALGIDKTKASENPPLPAGRSRISLLAS